eukprot:TRINITY_DN9277_c0_g2_i1.p1 TRINITY_DN9277_c0_g2~~TRINITY_DN9277_c0_g2_i1.p1  ORF type:complete len:103 (+),score=13.37 TRINITY_DN9277_c0_g2_i1:57-365(+)
MHLLCVRKWTRVEGEVRQLVSFERDTSLLKRRKEAKRLEEEGRREQCARDQNALLEKAHKDLTEQQLKDSYNLLIRRQSSCVASDCSNRSKSKVNEEGTIIL